MKYVFPISILIGLMIFKKENIAKKTKINAGRASVDVIA